MDVSEGDDGKHRDAREQHRMLDRILVSDYADVVHSILEILYQRVLELRHDAPPDSPGRSR